MTYRIRVKRPKWEDIAEVAPTISVVTVKSEDGTDLKVFDTSDSDSRIDIMEALANIKNMAGENLPVMTSLYIKGVNAQSVSDRIDTSQFPDYNTYSELCLYCTINGNRYCFGLSNDYASCF